MSDFQVVGPQAGSVDNYGSYGPNVNPKYATTPYDGLRALGVSSTYAKGCPDTACKSYNATEVQTAVTGANLVIVSVGLGTLFLSTDIPVH